MRLLVAGNGAATHARLAGAAIGLARRGHEVFWNGAGFEDARARAPVIRAGRGVPDGRPVDAVLGAGRPWPLAWRGWLAHARCVVAATSTAEIAAWGPWDRWAWPSLAGFALVEPGDAETLRQRPGPLALERVGLWSDGPPSPDGAAEHADTEILERACERIRARQRSGAPAPAVFLDRDGTLIHEVGYLSDPAEVRLLPGVASALARLRAAGYALIVISNQAGVGRGYFPLSRVYEAMAELRRQLRAGGVELDGIYFCPHAPDAGCACRKPGIELIERAAEDHGLSLVASVMIGDKAIDVEAGRRAGTRAILLETGYGREERARVEAGGPDRGAQAVLPDLAAAAAWLLDRPAAI